MNKTIDWLLEENNPSVQYRTRVELLGIDKNSPDCLGAKNAIYTWEPVKKIFKAMHPDGCWVAKGKYREYGKGLEYKGAVTTPHILHNLAEMGLDKTHMETDLAVRRYLKILESNHGFQITQSCIDGYVLRALIMLGYRDHATVEKLILLLRGSIRWDDGYFCKQQDKKKGMKSCMRGSWQVLMAFAELPEVITSETGRRLANYFLSRNLLYKKSDPEKLLRSEVTATIFPFVHGRASLLEVLYAMSKLGYGKHPATRSAWQILDQKKRDERYQLDWTPSTLFPLGKRGQDDKWATFYALLAKKYRKEVSNTSCVADWNGAQGHD